MSRPVLVLLAALCGCTPGWKQAPHAAPYQRAAAPVLHPLPPGSAFSDWWYLAQQGAVVPLARAVSPARHLQELTGGRPALDINAFGNVPDSTWFVNRIGRRPLTADEIRRGPNELAGPADGPLLVISGKLEGATPGVVIEDSDGVIWYVKFDPPAFPEMSSGAEIIAGRLLHAAGYWVPELHIVDLELDRLVLAPTAQRRDDYNRRVELTERDLGVLLIQLNPDPEGRLRSLFSRQVPGVPIGPFSYRGLRTSDPNDRMLHQRRRSLRGLWLFSAWVNNTDTRDQNTLDTFIPVTGDGELGYIRHYLLDFGDALGAAGDTDKYFGEGYAHLIDWSGMARAALGLGLRYPYWMWARRSPYRAVGYFEADVFAPGSWRPNLPNPAFDEATLDDTFWAASILARFTPALIAAAVETASYSEEGAADYVTRVLLARRDELLRYAFEPFLPLDRPEIEDGYTVRLTDLEVLARLRDPAGRSYRWSVRWNRTGHRDLGLDAGTTTEPAFDLRPAVTTLMTDAPGAFRDDPYLTLTIWRPEGDDRGPALQVHLRVVRDHLLPVALEREQR